MPVFPFLSSSIRRQLLAVLIPLTVIPMMILGLLLLSRGQQATRNAILRDYEEIVVQAALQIEGIIRTPQDMLTAMAATAGSAPSDPWQRETLIVELQLSDPDRFKQLALIDMSGAILSSGSMSYDNIDSLFFQTYTAGLEHLRSHPDARMYRSAIYFLADDVPAVTMATPVRRLGRPVGILAAQLTLREMWQVVDRLKIGNSGRAYIVSPEGVVIADQDKKAVLKAENLMNLAPVERLMRGETGSVDYIRPATNTSYLSAYAPLSFGWGLIVEQPAEEAYAAIDIMSQEALLFMAISLGVALLIGALAARSIGRPVLQLVDGTRRLSQGDLAHQIPLQRNDEIGQLALSFNEMARSLKVSYDGLEQQVEQKTVDLQQALDQVSHISDLKSRFVSDVSHELKTPLTSIQGYAETLLRLGNKISEAQQTECARIIEEESSRLARLIDNLLDLSRIEAGVIRLDRRLLDLNEIVHEAVQTLQIQASDKGINLTMLSGTTAPAVLADRDAIRRVMDNLIQNGIKYSEPGGRVTVAIERSATHVQIRVADTGIGISEENLKMIFDRFFRVKTPGAQASGTGLGLAIVRSLIEEHGGEVSVTSQLGKGSVFSFTVPLPNAEDAAYDSEEMYSRRR